MSGEPAPIPAYLTDKRLKIRLNKLPEKVRERLYRKGYVGLMVGDTLTWTHYEMDKPFIRISLNPVLRGLIQRAEGGARKIEVKILYNKHYWAIKYEKDLEIDGNILYFIESAKELLPGYIKTSKGTNTAKRTNYAPTNIRILEKEVGVVKKEKSKLKHLIRHRARKHANTTRPMGKRDNIQGKRTDNTIRISKRQDMSQGSVRLRL